jgi:hypothetical protein
MVKAVLVFTLFLSSVSYAQFWNFGDKPKPTGEGRIQAELDKLSDLNIQSGGEFEDKFNRIMKAVNDILEEEKLICSGEVAGPAGILTSRDQKQVCFREMKKSYAVYIEKSFEVKRKYLGVLHQKKLEDLEKIKKSQLEQLERAF